MAPTIVAYIIGGVVLLGVAPARPVAVVLLSAGGAGAASLLGMGVGSAWEYWADADSVAQYKGTLVALLVGVRNLSVTAPIVLLPQVFPDGVQANRLSRALFAVTVLGLAAPMGAGSIYIVTGDIFWDEVAWTTFLAVVVLGSLAGLGSLTGRFVVSSRLRRRQVLLFGAVHVALCTLLVVGLINEASLSDLTMGLIISGWVMAVMGSILYGVARHGLYNIRLVVRRVGQYTAATVLLTAVFVVVYLLLSALFTRALATTGYTWIAVVAAVVVVLLAEPIRRRLVGRLERTLLGYRGAPLDAFARLSIVKSTPGGEAYNDILQSVTSAVRAPGAVLYLQDASSMRQVASLGEIGEDPLVLEIAFGGELLGHLHVGLRTPGEPFPPVDEALLSQLAAHVSTLVYSARRDVELADARTEALRAIADERSRLGRNLHDGIAPLLAGAGLTAAALRRDLPQDSPAEHEAARLAERLRHAAGEVRQIAHGLDPRRHRPELDTVSSARRQPPRPG